MHAELLAHRNDWGGNLQAASRRLPRRVKAAPRLHTYLVGKSKNLTDKEDLSTDLDQKVIYVHPEENPTKAKQ